MRWAELFLSISRAVGKLRNHFAMNVNVVFRPLSAQCFADINEKKKQDEINSVLS